jgi:hypothetical protein
VERCKKPKQRKAFRFAEKRRRKVGCVMRKIVLALAVLLLAAPTWAAVNVDCVLVPVPGPNYVVAVTYEVTDTNDIRAFGIRIDVNNGATISDIDVNDTDYYIFPGSIDINDTTGEVDANGSAVADGGNGQSYMILEMGSLYAAEDAKHPIKPPQSGTICTFKVSKECVVTLSRDAERGGVVMENGSDYAGSLGSVIVLYDDCMSRSDPNWAEFDFVERPECWCYPRQCHGDADGKKEGSFLAGYWYVGEDDLDIMSLGWLVKDTENGGRGILDLEVGGVPVACADYTHSQEGSFLAGYWRIGEDDLDEMSLYWLKKEGTGEEAATDCPPGNRIP